jgi:hypothetical protein
VGIDTSEVARYSCVINIPNLSIYNRISSSYLKFKKKMKKKVLVAQFRITEIKRQTSKIKPFHDSLHVKIFTETMMGHFFGK